MAYDKLSTYRTAWIEGEDSGEVIYAHTRIVDWSADRVTLNSGGWETVTTKRKMNQASHQFRLGYRVYQRTRKWYVKLPSGEDVDFVDGMTFDRRGE